MLRVQTTGRNRTLLFFDAAAIQSALVGKTLTSASLELTIDSSASNWGPAGRPIAIHRLKQASAELSATWNCAIDESVQNSQPNCSGVTAWQMDATDPALLPWQSPATDTATISTGQTGVVRFDVTSDIAQIGAGSWAGHGWLVRKVEENLSGAVDFVSRERGPAPRLVLQLQAPDMDAGGSGAGGATAPDAALFEASVTAVADSYVRQGNPNRNEGTSPVLVVRDALPENPEIDAGSPLGGGHGR